jgi:hypothetical protein
MKGLYFLKQIKPWYKKDFTATSLRSSASYLPAYPQGSQSDLNNKDMHNKVISKFNRS